MNTSKIMDYTRHLLSKRRGVLMYAPSHEAEVIEDFALEYEDQHCIVGQDFMSYKEFASVDTKEFKNIRLFIFLNADKHMKSWAQAATQRLSRMSDRGKRFVFMVNKNPWENPYTHAYLLAKCKAFTSAPEMRIRYCPVQVNPTGVLRLVDAMRFELKHDYMCCVRDFVVHEGTLEKLFGEDEEHSPLGPSGLALLEKCPGSYYLEEDYETPEGAAMLGTVWHAEAENCLKRGLVSPEASPVTPYVDACQKLMVSDARWGIEETLNCETLHVDFWGTADFWAYNKATDTLHIIDYKNGSYPVKAEWNTQLIAYAVLVMETYHIDPKRIEFTVAQRGKDLDTWVMDSGHNKMPVFLRWHLYSHIQNIIDCVLAAEKKPEAHLSHTDCFSPFCKARHLHKAARKKAAEEAENAETDV